MVVLLLLLLFFRFRLLPPRFFHYCILSVCTVKFDVGVCLPTTYPERTITISSPTSASTWILGVDVPSVVFDASRDILRVKVQLVDSSDAVVSDLTTSMTVTESAFGHFRSNPAPSPWISPFHKHRLTPPPLDVDIVVFPLFWNDEGSV